MPDLHLEVNRTITSHNTTKPTMPLVQYPDSESDEADQSDAKPAQLEQAASRGALKRKRSESAQDDLPPLPAAFHDLYSTNARVSTSDNPSLHGGRKRAMPHVEGIWPSHVYLECKDGPVWCRVKWLSKLTCARGSFTDRVW
jgi:hypothetical protein